jgi:hypothetical protein
MALRPSTLRATAFLLVAALGVHELRYVLAYGERAGDELAHQGHGYLMTLTPLVGVVLAFALGGLLTGLARSGARERAVALRVRKLWPLATAGLLAIYGTQEVLEGMLSSGHPDGVAALFTGGGWIAVPLAVVGGLVVALAVRVAELVQRHSAETAHIVIAWIVRLGAPLGLISPVPAWVRVERLIAMHLAGRGPPAGTSIA